MHGSTGCTAASDLEVVEDDDDDGVVEDDMKAKQAVVWEGLDWGAGSVSGLLCCPGQPSPPPSSCSGCAPVAVSAACIECSK